MSDMVLWFSVATFLAVNALLFITAGHIVVGAFFAITALIDYVCMYMKYKELKEKRNVG